MKKILFFFLIIFCNCSYVPVVIEDVIKLENKNTQTKNENTQIKNIQAIYLIEPPYEINGKWFYPQDYDFFEEIGIAKKINDLNNGERTKNNEIFHSENLSAAHRSLPLPSTIRVTNLYNGYSVAVRINHRGAYSNTNIINLSDKVFKILKIGGQGDFVRISLIPQNETFLLNEAYTYEEERKVVEAPLSTVSIDELGENKEKEVVNKDEKVNTERNLNGFRIMENFKKYKEIYISIATFKFEESANYLKEQLSKFDVEIMKFKNLNNENMYRVTVGPYEDIDHVMEVLNDDTINKYEDLSIFLI